MTGREFQNDFDRQINRYTKRKGGYKRWQRVVSGLCAVVVFITTYALILPAITMADPVYCGFEEHEHDFKCYTLIPVCGYEDGELVPSAPYAGAMEETRPADDGSFSVIVEEAEVERYEAPFSSVSEEIAEKSGETQDLTPDEVLNEAGSPVVSVNETPAGELSVYEAPSVFDNAPEYEETPAYGINEEDTEIPAAGYEPESGEGTEMEADAAEPGLVPHIHTEDCYRSVLICDRIEHIHSDACHSNPDADLETPYSWEMTLPANLTGVWADDILAVAVKQLGYREGQSNYAVDEYGERHGITRYGQWWAQFEPEYDPRSEWGATFAAFCVYYANIPDTVLPVSGSASDWAYLLREYGLWRDAYAYVPEAGDLVFLDSDSDGVSDRVGIVNAMSGVTEIGEDDSEWLEAVDAMDLYMTAVYEAEQFFADDTAGLSAALAGIEVPERMAMYYEVPAYQPVDTDGDGFAEYLEEVGIEARRLLIHNDATIETIEGDLSNHADYSARFWTDAAVLGYARMPVNPTPAEPIPAEPIPAEPIPVEPEWDVVVVNEENPEGEPEEDPEGKRNIPENSINATGEQAEALLSVVRGLLDYYGAESVEEIPDADTAAFVADCLELAGIDEKSLPREETAARWAQLLDRSYAFISAFYEADYIPAPGDIVFLDLDADGTEGADYYMEPLGDETLLSYESEEENPAEELDDEIPADMIADPENILNYDFEEAFFSEGISGFRADADGQLYNTDPETDGEIPAGETDGEDSRYIPVEELYLTWSEDMIKDIEDAPNLCEKFEAAAKAEFIELMGEDYVEEPVFEEPVPEADETVPDLKKTEVPDPEEEKKRIEKSAAALLADLGMITYDENLTLDEMIARANEADGIDVITAPTVNEEYIGPAVADENGRAYSTVQPGENFTRIDAMGVVADVTVNPLTGKVLRLTLASGSTADGTVAVELEGNDPRIAGYFSFAGKLDRSAEILPDLQFESTGFDADFFSAEDGLVVAPRFENTPGLRLLSDPPSGDISDDNMIYIDSFRSSIRAGAVQLSNGDWVKKTDHYGEGQPFVFRVNFALSGTFDYEPGEIEVRVPASVLRSRNGEEADTFVVSVPHESDAGLTDQNIYVYRINEATNEIVVYNRLPCPAAEKAFFEIDYLTTEKTFEYADYLSPNSSESPYASKGGSMPITAAIRITQNGITKTETTTPLFVFIDTNAKIARLEKWTPSINNTDQLLEDVKNKDKNLSYTIGTFFEWQDEWGSRPANADEFVYVIWCIRSIIPTATQPYTFTLTDEPGRGLYVLGYLLQEDVIAGSRKYTAKRSVSGLTDEDFRYGRYDFVLTAVPKSLYLHTAGSIFASYIVQKFNKAIATVTPEDRVDPPTTAQNTGRYHFEYLYEPHPTGHFYALKYGYDRSRIFVKDSEDIITYDLSTYIDHLKLHRDKNDGHLDDYELGNLTYFSTLYGHPWPWTLPGDYYNYAGDPPSQNWRDYSEHYSDLVVDYAKARQAEYRGENPYGTRAMYWELDDGLVYGEGSEKDGIWLRTIGQGDQLTKLTKDDYYFDYVFVKYDTHDKVFDPVKGRYVDSPMVPHDQDTREIQYLGDYAQLSAGMDSYMTDDIRNQVRGKDVMLVWIQLDGEARWYPVAMVAPHNNNTPYNQLLRMTDRSPRAENFSMTILDSTRVRKMDRKVVVNGREIEYSDYINALEFIGSAERRVTAIRLTATAAHYFVALKMEPSLTLKNSETVMDIAQKAWDAPGKLQRKIELVNTSHSEVIQSSFLDSVRPVSQGMPMNPWPRKTITFDRKGPDYVMGIEPEGELLKKRIGFYNDWVKKETRVTWHVNLREWIMVLGDRDRIGGHYYINQKSGIFYDLLPEGGRLDKSSLVVYAVKTVNARRGQSKQDINDDAVQTGVELQPGEYSYTLTPDWRGSGRTMLKVSINVPGDQYALLYDTVHDHNDMTDYDVSFYNTVAYETGNTEIGDGRPDDAGLGTEKTQPLEEGQSGWITDKELMKELDPELGTNPVRDNEKYAKFLYSEAMSDIAVLFSGHTGLDKKVSGQEGLDYSYQAAFNNKEYSYRLRYKNGDTTNSWNMIFYDSMENFTSPEGGLTSDWHGNILRLDLSNPKQRGIDPKVYYSIVSRTITDPSTGQPVKDENSPLNWHDGDAAQNIPANKPDLADPAQQWKLLPKYDAAKWNDGNCTGENLCLGPAGEIPKVLQNQISALAFDLSKTTAGGNFVLGPSEVVLIRIHMKSPNVSERDTEEGRYPYAYNNVWLHSVYSDVGLDEGIEETIHQDFTTLAFFAGGPLRFRKLNQEDLQTPVSGVTFRLSGVSYYGHTIDETRVSDDDGMVEFENMPRGTYTLTEISTTPDYLLNNTALRVEVTEDGQVLVIDPTDSGILLDNGDDTLSFRYTILNRPRVHADFEFKKFGQLDGGGYIFMGPDSEKGEVIFRLSGTSDYGNEISMTGTVDLSSTAHFYNVEMGTYTLTEIATREDYILSIEKYVVWVDESGIVTFWEQAPSGGRGEQLPQGATGEVEFMNEPYHEVRFKKLDAKTLAATGLAGAKFRIYGTTETGERIDMTVETDANGIFSVKLPSGTYILEETEAPSFYQLDTTKRVVTVGKDGSIVIDGMSDVVVLELSGLLSEKKYSVYDESGASKKASFGSDASGSAIVTLSPESYPARYHVKSVALRFTSGVGTQTVELDAFDLEMTDENTVVVSYRILGAGAVPAANDVEATIVESVSALTNEQLRTGVIELTKYWYYLRNTTVVSEPPPEGVMPVIHISEDAPVPPIVSATIDLAKWNNTIITYRYDGNEIKRYLVSSDSTKRQVSTGSGFYNIYYLSWFGDPKVKEFVNKSNDYASVGELPDTKKPMDDGTTSAQIYMWVEAVDPAQPDGDLQICWWSNGYKTYLPKKTENMFPHTGGITELDLSGFDVSRTTSMKRMFYDIYRNGQNGAGGDKGTAYVYLFYNNSVDGTIGSITYSDERCTPIGNSVLQKVITDGWDTGNVVDMSEMFSAHYNTSDKYYYSRPSIKELDISHWNVSSVVTMERMFCRCTELESLNMVGSGWKNLNSLSDASYMFYYCTGMTTEAWENVTRAMKENWGTMSELTTTYGMFQYVTRASSGSDGLGLGAVDLSSWRPYKLKSTSYMFDFAGVTTANLDFRRPGYNDENATPQLEDASYMFRCNPDLTEVNIAGWKPKDNGDVRSMFGYVLGNTEYANQNLTKIYATFNWNNITGLKSREMFYFCLGLPAHVYHMTDYSSNSTNTPCDATYAFIGNPQTGANFTQAPVKSVPTPSAIAPRRDSLPYAADRIIGAPGLRDGLAAAPVPLYAPMNNGGGGSENDTDSYTTSTLTPVTGGSSVTKDLYGRWYRTSTTGSGGSNWYYRYQYFEGDLPLTFYLWEDPLPGYMPDHTASNPLKLELTRDPDNPTIVNKTLYQPNPENPMVRDEYGNMEFNWVEMDLKSGRVPFENRRTKEGSIILYLSKQVTGNVSEDRLQNDEFEFKITLTNPNNRTDLEILNALTGTKTFGDVTFVDGVATGVMLRHAQTLTVSDLPLYIGFEIEEIENPEYTFVDITGTGLNNNNSHNNFDGSDSGRKITFGMIGGGGAVVSVVYTNRGDFDEDEYEGGLQVTKRFASSEPGILSLEWRAVFETGKSLGLPETGGNGYIGFIPRPPSPIEGEGILNGNPDWKAVTAFDPEYDEDLIIGVYLDGITAFNFQQEAGVTDFPPYGSPTLVYDLRDNLIYAVNIGANGKAEFLGPVGVTLSDKTIDSVASTVAEPFAFYPTQAGKTGWAYYVYTGSTRTVSFYDARGRLIVAGQIYENFETDLNTTNPQLVTTQGKIYNFTTGEIVGEYTPPAEIMVDTGWHHYGTGPLVTGDYSGLGGVGVEISPVPTVRVGTEDVDWVEGRRYEISDIRPPQEISFGGLPEWNLSDGMLRDWSDLMDYYDMIVSKGYDLPDENKGSIYYRIVDQNGFVYKEGKAKRGELEGWQFTVDEMPGFGADTTPADSLIDFLFTVRFYELYTPWSATTDPTLYRRDDDGHFAVTDDTTSPGEIFRLAERVNGVYGDVFIRSGVGTFFLRADETVNITGLDLNPGDLWYEVTEHEQNLFTPTWLNGTGKIERSEPAAGESTGTTPVAICFNRKDEGPGTGGFEIQKEIPGTSFTARREFVKVESEDSSLKLATPKVGGTPTESNLPSPTDRYQHYYWFRGGTNADAAEMSGTAAKWVDIENGKFEMTLYFRTGSVSADKRQFPAFARLVMNSAVKVDSVDMYAGDRITANGSIVSYGNGSYEGNYSTIVETNNGRRTEADRISDAVYNWDADSRVLLAGLYTSETDTWRTGQYDVQVVIKGTWNGYTNSSPNQLEKIADSISLRYSPLSTFDTWSDVIADKTAAGLPAAYQSFAYGTDFSLGILPKLGRVLDYEETVYYTSELTDPFKFHVALSGLVPGETYSYRIGEETRTFQGNVLGEASLIFELKAGDKAAFDGLPVGAAYTVTELTNNYIASYTVTDSALYEDYAGTYTASADGYITLNDTVPEPNGTYAVTGFFPGGVVEETRELKAANKVISGLSPDAAYTVAHPNAGRSIAVPGNENTVPNKDLSTGQETVQTDEQILVKFVNKKPDTPVRFQKTKPSGEALSGAQLTLYRFAPTGGQEEEIITQARKPSGSGEGEGSQTDTIWPVYENGAVDHYVNGSGEYVCGANPDGTPADTDYSIVDRAKSGRRVGYTYEALLPVAEWITDGRYHVEKLPEGHYLLRETKAPAGYKKADDVLFRIDANGSAFYIYKTSAGTLTDSDVNDMVFYISMIDEPVSIQIEKRDNYGDFVRGARLTIYEYGTVDADGVLTPNADETVKYAFTTTNSAYKISEELDPGKVYRLEETLRPSAAYTKADDVWFVIRDDGSLSVILDPTVSGNLDAGKVKPVWAAGARIEAIEQYLAGKPGWNAIAPGTELRVYPNGTSQTADLTWQKGQPYVQNILRDGIDYEVRYTPEASGSATVLMRFRILDDGSVRVIEYLAPGAAQIDSSSFFGKEPDAQDPAGVVWAGEASSFNAPGRIAYCLDEGLNWPDSTGTTYTVSSDPVYNERELRAALWLGYPNDNSYTREDTQRAVWFLGSELNDEYISRFMVEHPTAFQLVMQARQNAEAVPDGFTVNMWHLADENERYGYQRILYVDQTSMSDVLRIPNSASVTVVMIDRIRKISVEKLAEQTAWQNFDLSGYKLSEEGYYLADDYHRVVVYAIENDENNTPRYLVDRWGERVAVYRDGYWKREYHPGLEGAKLQIREIGALNPDDTITPVPGTPEFHNWTSDGKRYDIFPETFEIKENTVYVLEETEAPARYEIAAPIYFMQEADGNVVILTLGTDNGVSRVEEREVTGSVRLTMYDKIKDGSTMLPDTGGNGGALAATAMGTVMALTGVGAMLKKKRESETK